jgi:hypothetical protein
MPAGVAEQLRFFSRSYKTKEPAYRQKLKPEPTACNIEKKELTEGKPPE